MIPIEKVQLIVSTYQRLEKELSSGTIDKKTFAEKSKEYSDLNEIVNDAKKYNSYNQNKSDLQKILDDKSSDEELIKMAEIELNDLNLEKEKNELLVNLEKKYNIDLNYNLIACELILS